jgi:hypothetical protein
LATSLLPSLDLGSIVALIESLRPLLRGRVYFHLHGVILRPAPDLSWLTRLLSCAAVERLHLSVDQTVACRFHTLFPPPGYVTHLRTLHVCGRLQSAMTLAGLARAPFLSELSLELHVFSLTDFHLIARLPALRRLFMINCRFFENQHVLDFLSSRGAQQLEFLHIHDCMAADALVAVPPSRAMPLPQFVVPLCLPNLYYLHVGEHCESIQWNSRLTATPVLTTTLLSRLCLPRLQHLSLNLSPAVRGEALVARCLKTNVGCVLRRVNLDIAMEESGKVLVPLLSSLTGSLEHVSLLVRPLDPTFAIPCSVLMLHNSSLLQSLVLPPQSLTEEVFLRLVLVDDRLRFPRLTLSSLLPAICNSLTIDGWLRLAHALFRASDGVQPDFIKLNLLWDSSLAIDYWPTLLTSPIPVQAPRRPAAGRLLLHLTLRPGQQLDVAAIDKEVTRLLTDVYAWYNGLMRIVP